MDNSEKTYIGPYKVTKYFRVSGKRKVLARGLTREEAMTMVQSFPSSNNWLVGFDKQFTADKHYV